MLVRLHTQEEIWEQAYDSIRKHENSIYGLALPPLPIWEQIRYCMDACKHFEEISGDRYEYEIINDFLFEVKKCEEKEEKVS